MLFIPYQNQLAAYQAGILNLNDLDDVVKRPLLNDFIATRVGFKPEAFCQVAGVTFEGRQALISLASKLCEFNKSPPVKLQAETTNPYDTHAVKVMVGTLKLDSGEWHFDHVGFIPRGVCLACGENLTGAMTKKATCHFCKSKNINLSFNQVVSAELLDNKEVKVGIDWISNKKDDRNSFLGIRLALGAGQ